MHAGRKTESKEKSGEGGEKKKLTPTPPAQNNSVLKMTAVKLGRMGNEGRGVLKFAFCVLQRRDTAGPPICQSGHN